MKGIFISITFLTCSVIFIASCNRIAKTETVQASPATSVASDPKIEVTFSQDEPQIQPGDDTFTVKVLNKSFHISSTSSCTKKAYDESNKHKAK